MSSCGWGLYFFFNRCSSYGIPALGSYSHYHGIWDRSSLRKPKGKQLGEVGAEEWAAAGPGGGRAFGTPGVWELVWQPMARPK